jgi:hypothetical protein
MEEEEANTKKPSYGERVSDEKVRERASVAATGTKQAGDFWGGGRERRGERLSWCIGRRASKLRALLVPAARDAR